MRYRRADIVTRAVALLDAYGLGDLSMRRLGGELGVQPSALYHHFANKQTLLAAVADEVLRLGARPAPRADRSWDEVVRHVCGELRDAMLAYRDGAELVATVHAFGLGGLQPGTRLEATLRAAGLDDQLASAGARTLLHYVFGHAADEQAYLQAGSAGAIDGPPRTVSDFDLGLSMIVDGLRGRVDVGAVERREVDGTGEVEAGAPQRR
jgi:TetR/AcrR family tetracycline transcriptional repressor